MSLLTLALVALVFALAILRHGPPPPRDAGAAETEVSAARARVVQEAIAGSGASRAVGTEAHDRARAYLQAELERAGFSVDDAERRLSCGQHGRCAYVSNVLARLDGREPDAAPVVLMAHYDSVPCSPGASDDGVGTAAVVETARAVAAGPKLRRPLWILLTDGEEDGMLGARAFAATHVHGARGPRPAAAVNVDSRGGRGSSALFETSVDNAWLVEAIPAALGRPLTSSLFFEVYRRMPNDTDLTVLKPFMHGVGFANIEEITRYHTPLDDLDGSDLGTLQHHADNALAAARVLGEAGSALDEAPRAEANDRRDVVWFDVLSFFVVRYDVRLALPLALIALALVAARASRRTLARPIALAAAPAALVAGLVAAFATGAALSASGALPAPWLAHPAPAWLAIHAISAGVLLLTARAIGAGEDREATWTGVWLTWAAIGVAVSVVAPGASFLFVAPTLIAGVAGWSPTGAAIAAPAVASALLWAPVMLTVPDATGFAVPAMLAGAALFVLSTLVPLTGDVPRRIEGAVLVVGLACGTAARLVPPFSPASPQRLNVSLVQEHDGEDAPRARVVVDPAWAYRPWGDTPAPMLAALGTETTKYASPLTWWRDAIAATVPPSAALPAPTAAPLPDDGVAAQPGRRRVLTRVRSTRGAKTLGLVFPQDRVTALLVDGVAAPFASGALLVRGVEDEGLPIALEIEGQAEISLTVFDVTYLGPGLQQDDEPGDAAFERLRAVLASRPSSAAATQEGDVVVSSTRTKL